MTSRLILAAFAATASLAVAACGGGNGATPTKGSTGSRGVDAKTKKALLNFAKCMREHGVDMPDPKFEGGGGVSMTRRDSNPDTARAAEKACQHFQDEVKPPPMSEAQQAQARKAALANSKCMRDHGFNMPDPQFGADGRMTMKIDKSSGLDPNDPKFQEASKACQKQSGMGGIMGGKEQ